jgi:hypothetical protein
MAIYLLVKEHAYTGLKYLCKRVASSFSECEKYKGSGTYWRKHLKKHGNNVKTTCLFVTEDKEEFRKVAKSYSLIFNVANSNNWANLCDEEGQGGDTVVDKKKHGEIMKHVLSQPHVRKKHMEHLTEHIKIIQPLAAISAKEKLTGIPKTESHKNNMRGKRPHINQSGCDNNNAKKIHTPFGIFGSIKEASNEIQGYTYRMIWSRLQKSEEWKYIK